MSREMKKFEGHWPKGGQGLGAGYVNPTPPRFVDERDSCFKNPHEASARRGQARGADSGNRRLTGGNVDVGGR